MNRLFSANSVVVIGVSDSENNLGKNILSNLINFGYPGNIYPVGPRGGEVFGHRIYSSVSEVPGKPELAVILTPARFVPDIVVECGKKGTQWAVIESAGFRELGPEGEELQEAIVKAAEPFGLRFVGPNCLGTTNTANGLYTQFVALPNSYRKGCTGVFAQSGGVGLSIAERICCSGVGISKLVSMGNKLSLDEADYLSYLADDPDTSVIYLYLEDIKRGRVFAEAASRCQRPIVLHKSNISSLSRSIAHSHTAALAADDDVVNAVCRECGIIRVHSVSEAITTIKGLSLPPLRGNRLAVISRSGGHAVIAADACGQYGFEFPALGDEILDECRRHARAGVIRFGNPLDLGDIFNLELYVSVVEKALRQDNVDGVVFIHVSQMKIERDVTRQLVEQIATLSAQLGKPVAVVIEVPLDERVLLERTSEFPFFLEPAEAVQALTAQRRHHNYAQTKSIRVEEIPERPGVERIGKWFDAMAGQNRQPLLHETFELLDIAGIPVADRRMSQSLDDTFEAACNIGFPVALKAVSPSLTHKSDRGGIVLNIQKDASLRDAWQRLQGISDDITGILVQKMVPSSRELIIGGRRDPHFGPVVLAGIGGVMVEVMKDFSMRLAPIDMNTALQMFGELSGKRILGRFRGMGKADLESAADMLVQVSKLMHSFPRMLEFEINPVSLHAEGHGAVALDARLLLAI
jgi:acetyltransferase